MTVSSNSRYISVHVNWIFMKHVCLSDFFFFDHMAFKQTKL